VRFPKETLQKISGSGAFTFSETPWPHYVGKNSDEAGSTVSLSTQPVAGEVRGYGGPINLLASVTDRGLIRGIMIVESRETPSYLKGMDEWLAKFRGTSILGRGEKEIDALTGATITCRAIKETLQQTGREISAPLLGLPVPDRRTGFISPWRESFKDVRFWMVLCLIGFFVFAFHFRSRAIRLVCLAVSLAIVGLYLNAPFTSLDAARLIDGEIPASATPWRTALFLATLLISVLWGQAFCGFLCPFGALQEFLGFKALRKRASGPVETAGRYLKFLILALVLCLFLVTDSTAWFSFSPLQHFFRGSMGSWVLGLSVAALAASMFYFRFWCRYLCPAGAFLALFNKLALLARWAPHPLPGRCDLGVTFTRDVDCIRCQRCLHGDSIDPKESI